MTTMTETTYNKQPKTLRTVPTTTATISFAEEISLRFQALYLFLRVYQIFQNVINGF